MISVDGIVLLEIIDSVKKLRIPSFRGVFVRDALPRTPNKNECVFLNLDDSSGNGTPWVLWYRKNNTNFYFDSYGVQPPQELQRYLKSAILYAICSQMNDTFLRRDGTNTAVGTINMTGNTFTNVSSPENDHDAANKAYVDNNAGIWKTGGEMLGNLDINNFRLTGLPQGLPEIGSDAANWSQAVQLVKDSEIKV